MYRAVLYLLLLSSYPWGAPPAAEDQPPAYLDEFDAYVTATILPEVPGVAVAVVDGGQIRLLKGYGVRQAGGSDPVTGDTVFRLASVSKTFASSAAALLVADGRLHWDDRISSLVDYVRFKDSTYGRSISVRNILSHTTGLVPHAYTNLIDENTPYRKVVNRLREVDFVCPPGSCYGYQNVAYSLIGDAIEKISGQPYQSFVEQHLFRPLGMDHASFGLAAFLANENHAMPHVLRRGAWSPVPVTPNYYEVAPAAGVNASAGDLGCWLLAQLGWRQEVLPDAVLQAVQQRVISTSPNQAHYRRRPELTNVSYGMGWRMFDFGPDRNFVHHGGGVQGTRAEVVFNRELQIGMAFLTNAATRDTSDVVFGFIEIVQRYRQQGPAAGSYTAGG